MHRIWMVALALMTFAGCKGDPPAAPEKSTVPVRGAAGDADLRVMIAELASSKACGLIRGGFQGLRAPEGTDVVTGVLWIRECEITNVGAQVTFHVKGNGWLWADQTKKKGGGTFVVRQYFRFGIDATMRGALDIAYDRHAHVVSLWFTPDRTPEVEFTIIGDVDVDPHGIWSSIVGAIGTGVGTSPVGLAESQAKAQGTKAFKAQLALGLAVTVDLCTGLSRVQIGRTAKGEMGPAGVGETRRVPVEIHPGGLMIVGPQLAGSGMTIQADAVKGAVRIKLMCAEHAETVAAAFIAGGTPATVPVLGSVDVFTKARLRIKPAKCPVVVVVTPLGNAPARFDWQRPASEIARSTGGPLINCRPKP